jgi:hypothetical protein
MNAQTRNLINVIATGVVVLVVLSLVLFCGRLFFWAKLIDNMPEDSLRIIISPSGLVPGEPAPQKVASSIRSETVPPGPNEPNFRFSQVYVSRNRKIVIGSAVGALWDITEEMFPFRDANESVYYWYGNANSYICLDKRSGLIIRNYKSFEPNDKSVYRETEFYAGPNGISEKAELSLGRFYDPVVTIGWDPNQICLYDKKTRRFYVIDFVGGSVSKGFQLAQGDSREPIANYSVGGIEKWFNTGLNVSWIGPEVWNAEKGEWKGQRIFLSGGERTRHGYGVDGFVSWGDFTYTYIPVLDKTGRIYIYNTKGESLTQAGYLPVPQSPFKLGQQSEIANPRNVLAYEVWPIYTIQRLSDDPNKSRKNFDIKYLGMNVACISREGTSMAVAVFDANGRQICRGDTKKNGMPTAEYIYSETYAPLATISLFLLENLQPPVFEAASYLCGNCIEASAGHRALYILPNSFLGMLGAGDGEFLERQILALVLMGPSLILSVWLAYRVRKDTTIIGLSGTAKKWWTVGTFAFGLPAYITYRLTRPKETLVTCQNCGNMRRPDMERCHRCGSKWEMPELTPPSWRIFD